MSQLSNTAVNPTVSS